MPRLRKFELCKVLRRAFVHGCRMAVTVDGTVVEFRICQFSIQRNHIHLICEASDNIALARGIQGWSVRVARGLNGRLGREGSVFDDRYHLEVLKTPSQTRNALCYVLQNARRHGERIDPAYHGMDPFSSAWWFDGWKDDSWKLGLQPPEVRTVAPVARPWPSLRSNRPITRPSSARARVNATANHATQPCSTMAAGPAIASARIWTGRHIETSDEPKPLLGEVCGK